MTLYNMIGYKLYKENEDGSIHMIRIVGMRKPYKITEYTKDPAEITIYDYDTNERKKVRVDSLSEYSPLKPDGVMTFSIANVYAGKEISKDVIITATKYLNIEFKAADLPYAVCRQSITDIFNNLVSTDESNMLVGLAVNQDTCPANFDYRVMFAANDILSYDFINFYRSDLIEDLFCMINKKKYDEVLEDLYKRHIKNINRPDLMFKKEHGGWCKDLDTLISQNNFQFDINQMLGITQVDFVLSDFFDEVEVPEKNIKYTVLRDDVRYWLSSIHKVNMKECPVLEFGHDINLGDFNDNMYLLIRDNTNKLYLVVYTTDGEYFEADLEAKSEELDFSSKFRISYIDKYNR